MGIQAVFFDLDGTLLPMDQDEFTRGYFKLLAAKAAPRGYEPKQLIDAIWAGTAAMVMNDGSRSNEEVFWKKFIKIFGEEAIADKPLFDEFYANEFENAKQFCPCNPKAAEAILLLKGMGVRLVLATNPIFPAVGTEARIRWAGLSPKDFELYTTYENSRYCKPNLDYYREILEKTNLTPEECLMVGNDVAEDMIAREIGMKVFLLTDCMINKEGRDISEFPHGGFEQLIAYFKASL